MPLETRYFSATDLRLELRESDNRPKIVGYAAMFNKDSRDLGGFIERIKPGAFDRAIREAHDVRALVDHSPSKILGRTKSGTLHLSVDKRGLLSNINPPNTSYARDVLESLNRGDLDGMSFAFRTLSDNWRMEDGQVIRELIDLELSDVSVVTYPAYPDTSVAARSLDQFKKTTKGKSLSLAMRELRQAQS